MLSSPLTYVWDCTHAVVCVVVDGATEVVIYRPVEKETEDVG